MSTSKRITVLCLLLLQPLLVFSAAKKEKEPVEEEGPPTLEKVALDGLAFRSIGPVVTGGRVIEIAVNPQDPNVYCVASGHGSLWKTTNRGVTFSPVFDGESSFSMGAVTLDPSDPNVVWVGTGEANAQTNAVPGDGVYRSEDGGKGWSFKANLPVAECYKVTVDNARPFCNVYIGTQDNNTLGGPSRTLNSSGITNADWYFTLGGDGFETQVDWTDPNIVYSQSQYGNLVRFDKRTGERLYLRAFEQPGEAAYRFDWDAALIISHHDHKRLYHGGNMVLRSDDRGESWREISPDLTRGVPQELMRLMDRSWSIDELVSKASSAHIVTLAESPLDENRLYAGSADGLLHCTHDGGASWHKAHMDGLPERARIHHVVASPHDVEIAYAACHDFSAGDFKPYLYKTSDGRASWSRINGNLPETGSTHTVGVDHVDPNLLFVGTLVACRSSRCPGDAPGDCSGFGRAFFGAPRTAR